MACLLFACTGQFALAAEPADDIYYNASIYTVDSDQPWAEAMAVRDGRIVSVGKREQVLASKGDATRLHDLDGAMIMPGLIDSHVHPVWGGLKVLYECNFPFSATPEEVAARVAECVAESAEGVWIRGGQWSSSFFERFDVASPKGLLDAVSADKAVILRDDSGHNAWFNSKALALAGITADTQDPADGSILRLAGSREPNGVLLEGAAQLAEGVLPDFSDQQHLGGARKAVSIASAFGITGIKSASELEPSYRALTQMDRAGELNVHMALSYRTPYGARQEVLDYAALEAMRDKYRSTHVDTRFVKIFMDGVPTPSRTAAMLADYLPEHPGAKTVSGEAHLTPQRITADLIELDKRGFTVKIHTAGDRSVRIVLDALEAVRKANGNSGLRHELAHAGFIDETDIPRFARLNVVADLSPYLWHPSAIMESVISAVGPRGEHYFPIRDLLDAHAPVLAGSDWPAAVETMNPWLGLEAMVTRADPQGKVPGKLWPEQAISLEEAVAIFTIDGARALRLEQHTGSLEVGKSADFVVLSNNIFDIAPEDISDVRVLRTVFEGRTVYSADDKP
ncbi:MAG: amidohydrolase [Parahaliea sp.]